MDQHTGPSQYYDFGLDPTREPGYRQLYSVKHIAPRVARLAPTLPSADTLLAHLPRIAQAQNVPTDSLDMLLV